MKLIDGIQAQRITTYLICTVIVTLLATIQSSAQRWKDFARKYEIGLEASYGVKMFAVSSNIDKINGLNVIEEGGAVGIVAGSKGARLRVKQGFYYSSSSVSQTIDEVRSSVGVNLYPIELFRDNVRWQPYLVLGLDRDLFKMYGFYGNEATTARPNYSVSEAPFLGKILTIQATLGTGLEYRIKIPGHFVNFFGEARYGKNIRTFSQTPLFKDTGFTNSVVISMGIRYGFSQ